MNKSRTIGLSLLLAGAALTFNPVHADETKPPIKLAVLSALEGIQWVEYCVQEHPEIRWLSDDRVRKTEEGVATLQGTYSERLCGQKYIEFDRTIMTLHCLRLILDGSEKAYQTFTSAQPEDVRLSRASFKALHEQGSRLLKCNWHGLSKTEMMQVMETALVLGDMGKSQKARELLKPYGITAPDHDDFYGEAMPVIMEHPKLCPSFAKLSPAGRELVVKIANLAHFGHLYHLEGGPGILRKLKESGIASTDLIAVELDLFIDTCDVAGAQGHVNNIGSIVYNKVTHLAMQAMAKAVMVLFDPEKTEWDAYNAYLSMRAALLDLNPKDPSDRVLTRIGAMVRLFTKENGQILSKAMLELDEAARKLIASQLNVTEEVEKGRTPTYMPAVLVNLSTNQQLGKTPDERLAQTIKIGLPFIAKVLAKHKQMIEDKEFNPEIPLNFNEIAGVAKSSPFLLKEGAFTIGNDGMVHLVQ